MRGSEAWEAQRKACSAPRLDASLVGAKNIILKLYKWEMAFFDGFRVLICPLRGYVGISLLLLLLLLSSWPTFFCGKWHPVFLSYGYNLYIGSDFLSCTAAPTLPSLCLRSAFASGGGNGAKGEGEDAPPSECPDICWKKITIVL